MAAFIIGNAMSVVAQGYGVLLVARFIAGLPPGAYFAVANLIAASMADPGKRGQAIARISLGLATATVIGGAGRPVDRATAGLEQCLCGSGIRCRT